MLNFDAIFGANKSNPIKKAVNTESENNDISQNIILFNDGERVDISSLNLTSDDKKNLEIAIALADIDSMAGIED